MDPNPYQSPRHLQEPPGPAPLEIETLQPVSVEFDLTLDDYVAFYVAHHSHPTLVKRVVLFLLAIGWVAIPLGIGVKLCLYWAGYASEQMDSDEVTYLLL